MERVTGSRRVLLIGMFRHPCGGGDQSARAAPVLALIILLCASCGSKTEVQVRLADARPAPPLPAALRGMSDAVLTRALAAGPGRISPSERSCVNALTNSVPAANVRMVERVDVRGTSLTFRVPGTARVFGCLSNRGPRHRGVTWCGHVVGEIRHGLLLDPRLDIACRDRHGHPWGSVWIDPDPRARWIVAREQGLAQVYPVVGPLPIRITTSAVDVRSASATFIVEQYDGTGGRVAFSIVRAAVAG